MQYLNNCIAARAAKTINCRYLTKENTEILTEIHSMTKGTKFYAWQKYLFFRL